MSTRATINRALGRMTGYELRKAASAITTRPAPSPPPPAKPAKPAEPRARAETFPKDYDAETVQVIRAVRPYTMTSHEKLHALIAATRYIARHEVPGDIVECGVWRGGSMHAVARTLDQMGVHDRDLWLYDTFEGMTEPTDKDVRHDGAVAADQLARQPKDSLVWACASLQDVQQGFVDVPYPHERLHFVKGAVEQTIPAQAPQQIALLRLDTDWYESTRHELEHLYDRLVPGGVLLLDDYGHWQGARQATDEFLERTAARLLLLRMGSGRIAVKPS